MLLFSTLPALCGVKVAVTVEGVSGRLYKNVLARLELNLHKDNKRLKDGEVRRLHRQAKKDIQSSLSPFGYYSPEIESRLVNDGDTWQAKYSIELGPPILVDEVNIKLVGQGENEQDLVVEVSKFPLKKGVVLDQSIYEKGKKRIISVALARGYLDAFFVTHELNINLATSIGSVQLVLQTGPQYLFGETNSTQQFLEDDLLYRYLPYMVGEPYDPGKIFELQSALYRTDYFSKVIAKGDTSEAVGLHIPVNLELSPPAHMNKYSLGLGYATDTGVRGKVDWVNRLFNDRGHKMRSSLLLAERESTFSLQFEIPRGDPRYEKLIHGVAYQNKKWEDTDTQLITAGVSREYSDPRFKATFGLQIRDEVYDIGNTSGNSTLLIPSLNSGFVYADDLLNTKNGIQANIGFLGSIDGMLADVSFLQTTLGGKAIVSPIDQWRLIARGSLGATIVDSIDFLPPSLRFYTGGDSSIRGYDYNSIGTKDDSGTVIGGRYLVVGSIEVEKLLTEMWSVASFFDVGSATDDLELVFNRGAGVGVRFRLPFGQVKLDVASAVSEDNYPLMLHFIVSGDL